MPSGALLAGIGPAAAQSTPPPNVLFVLMDDLGWRDLGPYGNRFIDTPNLDRFARESVRFTNAYAACPVCSPTRASIMTGKYPARLHLVRREAARAKKLHAVLAEWRRSAGAVMPSPNPQYDPARASEELTGYEQPTPPV